LNSRTQVGIYLGVTETLQVLRILTGIRFADPVSVFNRLALSDAIYILEWQLLPTQDSLNALYHASLGPEIQEAFRLAAFIYINMVLREMRSVNIGGLVRRLIEALQEDLGDTFLDPKKRYNEELLLWILFTGGVASTSSEEKQYFLQALGYICRERQFRSRAALEEAIDKVGPGLQSFSTQSAEMWTEMALL
jgi:Fungal specific transcription factor domain